MTSAGDAKPAPNQEEFEVTLLGPGYGESIVLHLGGGRWVIVDSCIGRGGQPRALEYLDSIGVNPTKAVDLVVATHWHDDHIRGMAKIVEVCNEADFCCAGVLCNKEFLAVVSALEERRHSADGSGAREIHRVFKLFRGRKSRPTFAMADRRIHSRGKCEIWSLSPDDNAFQDFLKSIGSLLPREGRTKTRIPSVYPNDAAVALWVGVDDIVVLLGADLEKNGWVKILQSRARPTGKASVFKVPHHGSKSAHEPKVWQRMLEPEPFAVLAPWRRGGRILPAPEDVRRILAVTNNAFVTAKADSTTHSAKRRNQIVSRTLRGSNIQLRQHPMLAGAIRLRRDIISAGPWKVETFGSACALKDFAA